MIFQSTRSEQFTATASQAILNGIAGDGGLYTPLELPKLTIALDDLTEMSYQQIAFLVLKSFLTDFSDEELQECIALAYSEKNFSSPQIAPLHSIGNKHYLELFHGRTIAFKDMALSILPYFMQVAARKNKSQKDILILTATSGDTGKAALAGFADVPNTRIVVFYPKNGVSAVQERQMVTQTGENTHVIGITGNFDDAQSAVKAMFTDEKLIQDIAEKGYQFSSANSINIGRLTPQIAYYIYAYAQLVKKGEIAVGDLINVAVPTGNFGNILAAYYAKEMGLPIKTLLCASNKNNVLTDFFNTGQYNKNREFYVTNSPSMDIVLSSNLERLLFHISGNQASEIKKLMNDLATSGKYHISETMKENLSAFYAGFASETETLQAIQSVYQTSEYVLDPHTAVADVVVDRYQAETGDTTPTIIAATASPYKFTDSVLSAIQQDVSLDEFERARALEKLTHIPIPNAVSQLEHAPILHDTVIDTKDIPTLVTSLLKQ